jgi:magnesium-transporting ATPase (P-type)
MFTNFVPISLYVTLEMVKVGQAYFMDNDILMYNEETDSCMSN